MRESVIERYLVEQVEAAKGIARKLQWICRRGAPDRVVILNGHTLFVEVKAPGKAAEAHQLREHERLREAGATVFVIDSFEEVDRIVGEYSGV